MLRQVSLVAEVKLEIRVGDVERLVLIPGNPVALQPEGRMATPPTRGQTTADNVPMSMLPTKARRGEQRDSAHGRPRGRSHRTPSALPADIGQNQAQVERMP